MTNRARSPISNLHVSSRCRSSAITSCRPYSHFFFLPFEILVDSQRMRGTAGHVNEAILVSISLEQNNNVRIFPLASNLAVITRWDSRSQATNTSWVILHQQETCRHIDFLFLMSQFVACCRNSPRKNRILEHLSRSLTAWDKKKCYFTERLHIFQMNQKQKQREIWSRPCLFCIGKTNLFWSVLQVIGWEFYLLLLWD